MIYSVSLCLRQVSRSDGAALASRFGCLFFEVSSCSDFLSVQSIFHEAVREVRREAERSIRPLFISEDKATISLSSACYKELPAPATAKLVTVKSSRAQSKRRAPTLTLLKGFKIFWHCCHLLIYMRKYILRKLSRNEDFIQINYSFNHAQINDAFYPGQWIHPKVSYFDPSELGLDVTNVL